LSNEVWSHQTQGSDVTRDWSASAIAIGKGGRVAVTGGVLDMFGWGVVNSWYLTNTYAPDGDVVWSRED
jgi:hypothetical protein